MTKRPKLSLSSPQQKTKKRPSAFKVVTVSSKPTRDAPPEPPAKPAASTPSPSPPPPRPPPPASVSTPVRTKRANVSLSKQPNWLKKGTIAKAVLVVGAAALSIFLLKRRLF